MKITFFFCLSRIFLLSVLFCLVSFKVVAAEAIQQTYTNKEKFVDTNFANRLQNFYKITSEKEVGLDFLRYFLQDEVLSTSERMKNIEAFSDFNKGRALILKSNDAQSLTKAYQYFYAATEKGDVESSVYVALCLLEGIGVEKDEKSALYLLNKASNVNVNQAQIIIGLLYWLNIDSIVAETFFYRSAESGNIFAKFILESQNSLHKSFINSVNNHSLYQLLKVYEIQLSHNNPFIEYTEIDPNKYNLVIAYRVALDKFKIKRAQSVYWTFLSARRGDVISQWFLFKIKNYIKQDNLEICELDLYEFFPLPKEFIYLNEKDLDTKALKDLNLLPIVLYYLKEKLNAENDYLKILSVGVKFEPDINIFQFILAQNYLKKSKYYYNPEKAIHLLKEKSSSNVSAMLELADLYYYGEHVEKNHDETKKWLKLAIKAKCKPAEDQYQRWFPSKKEKTMKKVKEILNGF